MHAHVRGQTNNHEFPRFQLVQQVVQRRGVKGRMARLEHGQVVLLRRKQGGDFAARAGQRLAGSHQRLEVGLPNALVGAEGAVRAAQDEFFC